MKMREGVKTCTREGVKACRRLGVGAWMLLATAAFAGVTRERRPEIWLEYGSRDAAISKVTFTVDGVDVSEKAKIGPSKASYTPSDDLAIGEHKVEVTVADEKGRVRTKKWSFTVDPNAKDAEPPVIEFAGATPTNGDRKSTRLNSSHIQKSRMPSSA